MKEYKEEMSIINLHRMRLSRNHEWLVALEAQEQFLLRQLEQCRGEKRSIQADNIKLWEYINGTINDKIVEKGGELNE